MFTLTKEQSDTLNRVLDKWRPVLGIRGALFGFKKNRQCLQVQLDSNFVEQANPEIMAEGFPQFHEELITFLNLVKSDVEYVKIEKFDIAENEFWLLAGMGHETSSKHR